MSTVAILTLELDELKDKRAEAQKEYEKAAKSLTNAKAAFLIGILLSGLDLFLGTFLLCGIGGLLLAAGFLSWLSNGDKTKKLKAQLDELDTAIPMKRKEIAEAS